MTNTTVYCIDREELAQFVEELLLLSEIDFASITITGPEKSGEYSVSIVTDTSSADIVENVVQNSYFLRTNISPEITPDG